MRDSRVLPGQGLGHSLDATKPCMQLALSRCHVREQADHFLQLLTGTIATPRSLRLSQISLRSPWPHSRAQTGAIDTEVR